MSDTTDAWLRALDRAVQRRTADRQPTAREQVITGAYGTADYASVAACYRQHEKLDYQGTLYRVTWLECDLTVGRFRAGVRTCRT